MRRGEVRWVDFEPSRGGEIRKVRPAVSNNAANTALNRVQVVPLTSSTGRVYPSEALVTIDGKQSKALADQMTTAAKEHLTTCLGTLSKTDMVAVERAIQIQLGLRL